MNELLSIDIQEYISEFHHVDEMNELYEKFEAEIKRLKAKDSLSHDEQDSLRTLEFKAFQLLRKIDSATK